jgi:hypothetical protein
MSSKVELKGGAKKRVSRKKTLTKVRKFSKKTSKKTLKGGGKKTSNNSSIKVRRLSLKSGVKKTSKKSSKKSLKKVRKLSKKFSKKSLKVRSSSIKGGPKKILKISTKKRMNKKGGGIITEEAYTEALTKVIDVASIIKLYKQFIENNTENLLKSYGVNNNEELLKYKKEVCNIKWGYNQLSESEKDICMKDPIEFYLENLQKNESADRKEKTLWDKGLYYFTLIPKPFGLREAVRRVAEIHLGLKL